MNDGVLNFGNTPLIWPQPTIITFDGPGAGTGPGQGTITFAINPAGTISGRYADAGGAIHAILRIGRRNHRVRRSGRGDRPPAGHSTLQHQPSGHDRGLLQRRERGVSRFPAHSHGVITTFNVPGAGTAPGEGTFAGNINPLGAIAGRYVDASDVAHGFCALRTAPSLRLMLQTAAQAPARAPLFLPAFASIPQGRSRELRLTRAMCITASYALRTAPSPRSTFRARAQARFKAHSRSGSTRPERLRETTLTRVM